MDALRPGQQQTVEMTATQSSQTFYRLYAVFVLVLIFVLVTLRSIPLWKPHLDLQSWTSAPGHNFTFSSIDIPKKNVVNETSQPAYNTTVNNPVNETAPKTPAEEGPQFELVLAHYKADYPRMRSWTSYVRHSPYVRKLGMRLIIYTKNPDADLDELKAATGADEVHTLPNVGREGQTILHHIIKKYDNPAQFTMFSQDEPEWTIDKDPSAPHYWYREKLTHEFRPNTGFLSLNQWNELCTCGDCGGRGQFPLQVAIYNMFERDICHGENYNDLWSQFIVSRARIQSRPVEAFKWLETMIGAPADHWVHDETQPDFIKQGYMPGGSTPSNPLFGHTLERSWPMIFSCSFPERVKEEGLGIVDDHRIQCFDWEAEHLNDTDPLHVHWPGFEQADRAWAIEEKQQKEEDKKKEVEEEKEKLEEEEAKLMDEKKRLEALRLEKIEEINKLQGGKLMKGENLDIDGDEDEDETGEESDEENEEEVKVITPQEKQRQKEEALEMLNDNLYGDGETEINEAKVHTTEKESGDLNDEDEDEGEDIAEIEEERSQIPKKGLRDAETVDAIA